MIGTPKHDEPLSLGEAVTAWRFDLRRTWTLRAVLRVELGCRAFDNLVAENPPSIPAAFAFPAPRRAQSAAWDHSKAG
jgi:hypothetical protein